MIIDPAGQILAAAAAGGEELIQADISEDLIADVRSRVPAFEHRRGDLYHNT